MAQLQNSTNDGWALAIIFTAIAGAFALSLMDASNDPLDNPPAQNERRSDQSFPNLPTDTIRFP